MARTIRLVLIAGALFVAPLNAAGEGDPKAQAVKLLREGNRLFQSGDHEGALTSYRKAKAAFPSYKLEFNMARSLEALRRPAQAAESYERFLAGAEKSQDSANISAARGKVGMLRTSLASLTLKGAADDVAVAVGKRRVGTVPLGHRIYLLPGANKLVFGSPGKPPRIHELSVTRGQRIVLDLEAVPESKDPIEEPEEKDPTKGPGEGAFATNTPVQEAPAGRTVPIYKKWWFRTAVGTVVVGAVVGGSLAATAGGDDRLPESELGWIR